jgi:type VI secretion system protein ImpL
MIDYAGVYFTGNDEKLEEDDDEPGFFGRLFRRGKKDFAEGAWKANLKLGLREVRRRRPIDGMIVAVDARSLMERGPDAITRIQRRAETVAERIHEAQHTLGVHFPTYVVLTHCEAIPGFEVFAQAMPEVMRDQMFGWSSPYDTDTSYQPSWVDEAINSVHEAISVTQLDLLPHVGKQTDRDALYLLPKQVNVLRAALKAYLDPIFKATSYRQALPLRGIYMTAQVSDDPNASVPEPDAPEDLMAALMASSSGGVVATPSGDPPKPAFIRQLLTEKVFRESGLTRLDDEQKRKLKKKVRWYRIAVTVVALIGLGLILYQRSATDSRIEKFAKVKSQLDRYRDKVELGQTVEGKDGIDTLKALAELDVNGFEIATAPTSYFNDLTDDTNDAIAQLLSVGVAKPLRTALVEKANTLLPPPSEEFGGGDNGNVKLNRQRTRGSQATMREGLGRLDEFSKKIDELRANFKRYEKHSVRDLAPLFKYLTGKEISGSFAKNAGLYDKAVSNPNRQVWEPLEFKDYKERAKRDFKKKAAQFQEELFTQNLLAASLKNLSDLLDTVELRQAGESYNDRLLAIDQAIKTVESHIASGKAKWLLPETFKPGGAYKKLLERLDVGDTFPMDEDLGEGKAIPLGESFQKTNQHLFSELRNRVWGAESRSGNFRLLGQQDGKVVLSDDLDRIKRHVNRYIAQPYVSSGDQTSLQLEIARQAGLRDGWNETLLRQLLDNRTKFDAFKNAPREELPGTVSTALGLAAAREFQKRIGLVMEYAQPANNVEAGDAAATWTPQRKEELKNRIRNLKAEHGRILEVISTLQDVNRTLSEPENRELFNALRDDIISLLSQVDSILKSEKLYQINQQDFSWWEGDLTPNVVAFGARDSNDLVARLEVQRTTIQTLANEFARPLDEVITAVGEPLTSNSLVNQWKEILGVLDEYDKKVPGNSLEKMERFIETDLGDLKLETCKEQLKPITSDRSGKNYFEARMYRIATQMQSRCDRILKKVTVEGYLELQQFFENRMLGKFPFSGPDVLAEVETGEVVEFYKLYDKYAPAFEALIKPKGGRTALFDNATAEIQRFLAQVDKARRLFKDMLNAEDENPDLVLDSQLDFRVNRDNELGGNQIIDWFATVADSQVSFRDNKRSVQWRSNDPLGMCFRWARDADFIPAANQRNEQLRVNGREACFVYSGRWALLRMLVAHATTPADRGRRSFLRPHTLRFEIETSLASSRGGAGAIAQDARVYTRIGILLPGEKSASKLPEFPRRAPEIPKRVLQKHQILTDKKGGR